MLLEINRYIRKVNIPESTFGRRVANDSRLVRDIRAGRTVSDKLRLKINEFIKNHPNGI